MAEPTKPLPPPRPTWPAMTAALTAMAALYVHGGQYLGLPVLALAMLAVYVVDARLPEPRLATWVVRAVLYAIIVVSTNDADSELRLVRPPRLRRPLRIRLRRRAGRAMLETPRHRLRLRRNAPALGPGFHGRHQHLRTKVHPLVHRRLRRDHGALRDFRTRTPEPPGLWRPRAAWAIAVLAAMGVGLGLGAAMQTSGDRLLQWSVSLLINQRDDMGAGLSALPQLGGSFNPRPSIQRMLRLTGTQPTRICGRRRSPSMPTAAGNHRSTPTRLLRCRGCGLRRTCRAEESTSPAWESTPI